MSLAVGKKLGVFEISTLLGVGGMGEVYRARDTKLGREVAIKVLPEEFANDRDRLARFQREARLLAALNHPNIAHLHDLEEADGQHFLVMELVEGETLADRISRGPLPLEDVLKVFGQIAEGLEAAHQQGVIHRDLKPANIKITDDGKVSVLDFGLAKAAETQPSATNDGVTSPWDDRSAGKSSVGQIVGTPAYMSPEQARGKPVDKRTDIWAFGCCLYEALTGQRSFRGETVSDTLAMILAAEPDWKELPKSTPPRLRELLERCLAKDLRSRQCDIGDARIELGRIASNPGEALAAAAIPAGMVQVRRSRFVAAIVGGLLVASLTTGAAVWRVMRPDALPNQPLKSPQGIIRTTIDLPPKSAIAIDPTAMISLLTQFSLSPDGKRLVYVGGLPDETRLYLRGMDQWEPSPLPGTEGAASPFFSPDGKSVGFTAHRKLKTIRIGESQPMDVCNVQNLSGASWGPNGTIYFAESQSSSFVNNEGLKRVRLSGGAPPEYITHNEDNASVTGHAFPCALPDGKSVLFTLYTTSSSNSSIAILSPETDEPKTVVPRGRFAKYLPSGHLLFYDEGWFKAARFDTDRLEVVGRPVKIVQSRFLPAVSDTGCLVHGPPFPGEAREGLPNARPLAWVDRHGETKPLKVPRQPYMDLRLSPDGKRLAVEVRNERGAEILIYDIERETHTTHLTSGGYNSFPVWTPDGERLIFASMRKEKWFNLNWAPADGSAKPQPLTDANHRQFPYSVSPERILAFSQGVVSAGLDIYTLPLDDPSAAEPFVQTEFYESSPAFSPDGRWLAYVSEETGQREVFVQPYPRTPTSAPKQISDSGGGKPLWSKQGDKLFLFYRDHSRLYSVEIKTEPAFKADEPKLLLDKPFGDSLIRRGYDISRDGERFLFMELTDEEAAQGPVDKLFVVQNWFEELKRLVPAEGGN